MVLLINVARIAAKKLVSVNNAAKLIHFDTKHSLLCRVTLRGRLYKRTLKVEIIFCKVAYKLARCLELTPDVPLVIET